LPGEKAGTSKGQRVKTPPPSGSSSGDPSDLGEFKPTFH
jgi:hypothetical protein